MLSKHNLKNNTKMKNKIHVLLMLIIFNFSANAQAVDLKRGLVAYYPFNGNANDESRNGNNGTIYGATLANDKNDKSNSAYYFNGSSDHIDLGNNISFNNRSFTVSFFEKTSSNPGVFMIFLSSGKEKEEQGLSIGWYSNYFRFSFYGRNDLDTRANYSLNNQWRHWVCVYDYSTNKRSIYLNGIFITSDNHSGFQGSGRLILGTTAWFGKNYFRGILDDIRIYNRVLNENEIQSLYNYQEKTIDAPVITFNHPNSTYLTFNQPIFHLNACIKSSEPLKNYSVYVNDNINLSSNVSSSYNCDFKLETTINLQEGNNTIKVVAENSGGSTISPIYTINYAKVVADNTPPQIVITYPNVSRGFKSVERNKQITITGKATDASGIFEVLINGQEANVDAQGNFSKTVLLAVGDNSFTVTANDLKQNTSTTTFTVERQTNQSDIIVVNNQTNQSNELKAGKYYALIIGNNTYQDPSILTLNEPINDATKLYNALTIEYTFEPQNVTFLKNASYIQMIEEFDKLSSKIMPNDNLLVFYAGHGWWDETKNLGYWLPCDAKKSNTAFWIPNSRITDYMSSINSKHTLLIADACFGGSIFKTRSAFADAQLAINKLYELPSKKAMTSGNLKEVPDRSVFLQFLVKRLQDNKEKYLSSDMLFASFRQAVLNNSPTEPQYGTIQNAGDEGGEFIFIRRDK